jgi:hypothetical protein
MLAPAKVEGGRSCLGACTERPLHADALKAITEVTTTLQHSLVRLENLQKLTELQRDLVGIENLTAPGRVSVIRLA